MDLKGDQLTCAPACKLQVRHAHAVHPEHKLIMQLPPVPHVTKDISPWPIDNHEEQHSCRSFSKLRSCPMQLLYMQTRGGHAWANRSSSPPSSCLRAPRLSWIYLKHGDGRRHEVSSLHPTSYFGVSARKQWRGSSGPKE